jgi:AcrR family transcriptional regulator
VSEPDADQTPDLDQVIAAARLCFQRFGLRRTTMEDIAEEAGIGRTSVYRLGVTRAELTDAAILSRIRELRADLWPLMRRTVDFDELLVDSVAAALSWARDDAELIALVGQAPTTRLHNLFVRRHDDMHELVLSVSAEAFARARERGQMRVDISDDDGAEWIQSVFFMLLLRDDIDAGETRRLLQRFLVPALASVEFMAARGISPALTTSEESQRRPMR